MVSKGWKALFKAGYFGDYRLGDMKCKGASNEVTQAVKTKLNAKEDFELVMTFGDEPEGGPLIIVSVR